MKMALCELFVSILNFFKGPNFHVYILYPFIATVFSGMAVACFSVFIVNRHFRQLLSYQKLKEVGFESISFRWQSEREVKKMCKKAEEIKTINVSGLNYYKSYEKHLKKAMAEGVKICALVADPDSGFLTDIEEMEKVSYYSNGHPVRRADTYIKSEIEELLKRYADTNLQIRFYCSEYRLPFILAYYKDGSIHTWLRVTLPPARSERAIVLRGKEDANNMGESRLDFIKMMEESFDKIWDHSKKSEDKVKKIRDSLKNASSE